VVGGIGMVYRFDLNACSLHVQGLPAQIPQIKNYNVSVQFIACAVPLSPARSHHVLHVLHTTKFRLDLKWSTLMMGET
jgi:hypothetical protein